MDILSYRHKGLKTLAASKLPKNVRGIPADFSKKVHAQLTFIQSAAGTQGLASMTMWKVHELKPKFPGKWSMWVSGNYRLTFWLEPDGKSVRDVDLEDYH